ncbi:hypothetical protein [Pantoea ananatis]|uniref:hypothetical protein n=1 Tax=Pantoea ananas TaxID=553 RepID=UPI0007DAC12A|nr:hypothetical protein [Pantoea ananatis]
MFNKEVLERITWLYSIFDIKLLTFIAAGFTIYFGYQKITKKICVSYAFTCGTLYDTHITNFVISNKRDNVIIVSSIYMRIGNKGSIQIINFPEPLVLKGYDAKLIDIPQYSSIYGVNGPISITFDDRLSFSLITIAGDMVACEVESPATSKDLEGRLLKSTIKFNDIILTRNMGFIFTYSINGTVKNVIFDKHGFIEGYTPFSYNMFKDISADSFGDFLISNGYHELYDDYSLYKILGNLDTSLVLSKASKQKKQ